MKNQKTPALLGWHRAFAFAVALLAAIAATPNASAQAITTGSIAGRVLDPSGAPISGATVTVRNVATGYTMETTTRSGGTYLARGLRPGGPYSVASEVAGFEPFVFNNIYVDLGDATEINIRLREEESFELEALAVTGSDFDQLLSSDRMGSSTTMGLSAINNTPVGDRSLNSLLRNDPRIIYNRNPSDQAISAGGVSNRYNQILIDGVSASDPFGLGSSGMAASRNVVPLNSIESITVSTSPFNARQSGFTGAGINAVTKSGTNELAGSLQYQYRGDNFVRKNLETHTGQIITVPEFTEETIGADLSGPIIKDKLFFYISYEAVREDRNPPAVTNFPTSAALADIVANARTLGFEPGAEAAPQNKLTDDGLLVKLDWQVNQDHRVTVRYNDVESSRPTFPGYGGRNFSFDSHWYDQAIENTSYVAQLVSTWSSNLSTEVSISYNEYYSEPLSISRSPQVIVYDVPVDGTTQLGSVRFGKERSRHFNLLETETWTGDFFGEYYINEQHTLTFGYQVSYADVFNAFVQDFLGNYEFDDPTALANAAAGQAGWDGRYRYQFENPGINPAAQFKEENHAFFIQDRWQVSPRLRVDMGLRIDMPHFPDAPANNVAFQQTFGFRNNHTYAGNSVIQPRVGFNLKLDDAGDTVLRGGFGLFYGQMPRVWMSNSYSNTGMNFSSVDLRNANTPVVSSDPDNQPPVAPDARAMQVNALDPDFELPSRWKYTLGLDRRVGDLLFTAEFEYATVNNDVLYQNINRVVQHVAFDGREILGGRVSNDFVNDTIYLTNTNKGWSNALTLQLQRPRQDDGWHWSVAYTNSTVREVQYGTSSVARSNWANRAILNQGEDKTSRGELEIKHRVIGLLQKDFDWGTEGYRTTISLFYEGRSGLPFNFTYSGSVNNDGVNGNDLIYVPAPGDPRVNFATAADEANFFRLVDAWNLETGKVSEGGKGRYPDVHQFDLSFAQQIKLPGWKHSIELTLDILNIGNLINSEWGQIRGSNSFFVKNENVARATYDPGTDTYTYSNVNTELADKNFTPFSGRGEPDASRWSALAGVRYKF